MAEERTIELTADEIAAFVLRLHGEDDEETAEVVSMYRRETPGTPVLATRQIGPGSLIVRVKFTKHPDALCGEPGCEEEAVSIDADGQRCKDHTPGVPVAGDW